MESAILECTHSEVTKEKIRTKALNRTVPNPMKDKHYTDKAKQKISKSRKGKLNSGPSKKIIVEGIEYNSLYHFLN
jgi:hypothetical protein